MKRAMNNEGLEVPLLEGFREALQQRRYRQSTIKGHVKNIGYFLQWVNDNQLYEIENVQHKNILEYVQYEQKRNLPAGRQGLDTATINLRLSSISKYFDFLKTENIITRNPARILRIKGKLKTITEQPLKYEELEQLYFSYKQLNKEAANNVKEAVELAHQRNIIIVGLLVWQGLHSGELEKLEVGHINLDAGKIYIPSTARGNSRELKLHVQQVIHLHTYLHGGIREKLKNKGDKLFAARCSDIIQWLIEELKGINPTIKNAQHIRASVILYWLKQYNKRQVQYMAGHKYIDSTERYALQQTDTLTDLLTKHHPFG
jgi:site-specific recombinase XerD